MAANLIVGQEARDDMSDAHDWYENDRPGRGDRFLLAVERCFTTICRVPRGGRPFAGRYRQATVQRFPYTVVYHYDPTDHTVRVHAVYHASRDPGSILDRLP